MRTVLQIQRFGILNTVIDWSIDRSLIASNNASNDNKNKSEKVGIAACFAKASNSNKSSPKSKKIEEAETKNERRKSDEITNFFATESKSKNSKKENKKTKSAKKKKTKAKKKKKKTKKKG